MKKLLKVTSVCAVIASAFAVACVLIDKKGGADA